MKIKNLFIIFTGLVLLLAATITYALYATSSGIKNADAEIYAGSAYVTAVTVNTDGTNDANVILYDGGASGVSKYQLFVDGGVWHGHKDFVHPIIFTSSVYADVTGTDATYIVEYSVR